ncbi:hypothetical protein Cni_G09122 [Canna indica]|uniref:Uncharacterized protein n=1 Tax=Canna indica TaxID=4628 RepID=A0AAQ3K3D2_9LILI|nr:hypothetical protein Cni_G09122 [Canna indica]
MGEKVHAAPRSIMRKAHSFMTAEKSNMRSPANATAKSISSHSFIRHKIHLNSNPMWGAQGQLVCIGLSSAFDNLAWTFQESELCFSYPHSHASKLGRKDCSNDKELS